MNTDPSLSTDLGMALLISTVSLLAVTAPLLRGVLISLRALAATRRVVRSEIDHLLRKTGPSRAEPVTLQMLRVLRNSMQESGRDRHPTDFLVDASRQYVAHDYEAHYARPISMCANILPPIGFIGTTGGLLVLFLSRHLSSDSLELGALAMALTSSLFALIGFALLEGFKFSLYRRLLARLDDAVDFFRNARRASPPAGESLASRLAEAGSTP